MVNVDLTADEIVAAADTLEKLSRLYDMNPYSGLWSAVDLRDELPRIEQDVKQKVVRRAIAQQVESEIFAGLDVLDAVTTTLRNYTITAGD